jgi:hypothetical protein
VYDARVASHPHSKADHADFRAPNPGERSKIRHPACGMPHPDPGKPTARNVEHGQHHGPRGADARQAQRPGRRNGDAASCVLVSFPKRMTAIVSSRTPGGHRFHCPICRHRTHIEASQPTGDIPCPCCGHLVWIDVADECWPEPVRLRAKRRTTQIARAVRVALPSLCFRAGMTIHQLVGEARQATHRVAAVGGRLARALVGVSSVPHELSSTDEDPLWDRWIDG